MWPNLGRCSNYEYAGQQNWFGYGHSTRTHLIMYGMRDAAMHANAAHASNRPFPSVTLIPNGTSVPLGKGTIHPLMSCAFLMMTVHITAPISKSTVANKEKTVESRNPKACLMSPLEAVSVYKTLHKTHTRVKLT